MKWKVARRVLLGLLLVGVLAYVSGALVIGGRLAAPALAPVGDAPASLGAASVAIPSDSGSTLSGWWIDGAPGRGTVVLLHPLRSTRRSMQGRAQFLSEAGYAVLLFDFQAHGESPGEHLTFGHLESKDAAAALCFARERNAGNPVAVLGMSLGAAAAVLGEEPLDADAFILEAMYPTVEEAVEDRIRIVGFGPFAKVLAPGLLVQLRPRLGVGPEELRPIEGVTKLRAPVFIIAGTEDRHTPLSESERIFQRAPEPKKFWAVDGAAHVNFHEFAGEEYEKRVLGFIDQAFKQARRGPGTDDTRQDDNPR